MKEIIEYREGATTLLVPKESSTKSVFFNPKASVQRSISVALLKSSHKKMRIADVLCATGARSARFMNEAGECVESIDINDANPKALAYAKENCSRAVMHNEDASVFLLKEKSFDYIDIDPFGSPIPFLDAACKNIRMKGIIAVTATDLAALSGKAVSACLRKYWARPLKNEFMHETGMRILIRRIQLLGAQYDKALVPIYAHWSHHYARIYVQQTKRDVKDVLNNHRYLHYCFVCLSQKISQENMPGECCKKRMSVAGPLFVGPLWDVSLAKNIAHTVTKDAKEDAQKIAEECEIPSVGFYSLRAMGKKWKVQPKKMKLIEKLRSAGFKASETHFAEDAIRTNARADEVKELSTN